MAVITEPPAAPTGGPKPWPEYRGHWLRGALHQIQNRPLDFYSAVWRQCGRYVRIRALPGAWFYLLTHPDGIEHVLQKNPKNYRKPDVLIKPVRLLMGNGLFSSEGDFWLRQRRLMQPAFHRQQIAALSRQMATAATALVEQWDRGESGRVIDVVPDMMRLTLGIASTTLFSHDVSGEADTLGRAFRVVFEYISRRMNSKMTLPLWVPTAGNRAVRHAKELLDRVVMEVIEGRRRHGPGPGDLLDLLLAARDEESGSGMTDQQLRDEVLTLLTAGHDTMGAALSWTWHLLGQRPDVQEALADEARGRLGGRPPEFDDLPHLPLARAVFDESLRLYPPAPGVVRETIHPDEIAGRPVPAKAAVLIYLYITQRDPEFWEEPERFKPERFLPGAPAGRPKFAYLPFGGGPRVCIGNTFALAEGPLVLAALAQRFRLVPVPGADVVPDPTFTLRPKNGVRMTLHRR
ncbi:MAG TPA: cytochrome P450 [Gemmataceae bacterium]|nr:cytochrome P450 [Gemmataceae bacterium]